MLVYADWYGMNRGFGSLGIGNVLHRVVLGMGRGRMDRMLEVYRIEPIDIFSLEQIH